MRIFAVAASLREGSYNRQLLEASVPYFEEHGADVEHRQFSDFDVPLYDKDIEKESGIARGAREFEESLLAASGFVIVTPEYNHSIPGTLKNLIDWVSRIRPNQPFRGKPGMLMSASPSMVGGSRGLLHTRVPLQTLGARVFPDEFSLARAHEAFGEDGGLLDEKLDERLRENVADFVDFVGRLTK